MIQNATKYSCLDICMQNDKYNHVKKLKTSLQSGTFSHNLYDKYRLFQQ
jgi:hypothetical protein